MWILDCAGDLLEGRRLWLKPGRTFTLGRNKHAGIERAIDHKTVSRTHFQIEVYDVDDETMNKTNARSKIRIEDLGSKTGTTVNDKVLKKEEAFVTDSIITVRPGTYPHVLTITWTPQIFTTSFSKKEILKGDHNAIQQSIKHLDIRAITEYKPGETTLLLAQKRNTAKVLQALIEGKPIVKSTFLDSLLALATSDAPETLSKLEADFDRTWPDCDPVMYLPPPGKETTDKPVEAYRPDQKRSTIFDKHTFFFFDSSQLDTLLQPITTGHGKAVMLTVSQTSSTVAESVKTIMSTTKGGHAVIVKLNDLSNSQPWLAHHIDQVCSEVGIEGILQAEIIDAILGNNSSQLRKAVNRPTSSHTTQPSTDPESPRNESVGASTSNHDESSAPTHRISSPQPSPQDDNPRPRKRIRPMITRRKIVAFDDGFNPDAVVPYEDDDFNIADEPQESLHNASPEPIIKDEPAEKVTTTIIDDSEDEEIDRLLPATAAMRRQKKAQEAEAREKGIPLKSAIAAPKLAEQPKAKKEVKLVDVRETAKARTKAEDEKYQKEQDELQEMLDKDGEFGNKPANLVNIVQMELPERLPKSRPTSSIHGSSWRDEWQGRPNYKGFRRRGQASALPPKIIIPLVVQNSLNSQSVTENSNSSVRQSRGRRRRGIGAGSDSDGDEPRRTRQPGTIRRQFAAAVAKKAREACREQAGNPTNNENQESDDDVRISTIKRVSDTKRPATSPPAGERRREKQPRVSRRPRKGRFGITESDSESSENESRLRRQKRSNGFESEKSREEVW